MKIIFLDIDGVLRGTYFIAVFRYRKHAEEQAAKWPNSRVVEIQMEATAQ